MSEHGLEDWGHEDCSVCEAARNAPTPEKLKAWAEWFDDPKNPPVIFKPGKYRPQTFTAGFVLREFARALGAEQGKPK